MPLRRIESQPDSALEKRLIDELATELLSPTSEEAATDQPSIVEEEIDARTKRLSVTVEWEKWKDIPIPARGGIILEAYKKSFGEDRMYKITRALGVTPDEAQRLKISV